MTTNQGIFAHLRFAKDFQTKVSEPVLDDALMTEYYHDFEDQYWVDEDDDDSDFDDDE